jgi:hypothetical protein
MDKKISDTALGYYCKHALNEISASPEGSGRRREWEDIRALLFELARSRQVIARLAKAQQAKQTYETQMEYALMDLWTRTAIRN